jgi:hypothetical protein
MAIDGGRAAARGFQYQYLRTLETLLDFADDPLVHAVRIEGPADAGVRANAVDFDVVTADGACALAVQVKSRLPGGAFEISDAISAMVALVKDHDASSYRVLTNGIPSQLASRLSTALSKGCLPDSLRGMLEELLASAPARLAQVRGLTAVQEGRLSRCRLLFDDRDLREIRIGLRERLRDYRNRALRGLGEHSAGMLTGYLVAEILRRAADPEAAELTVRELRSLLLIDGRHLSGMTGERDWGVIIGPLPPIPDVARPAVLSAIGAAMEESSGRQVRQAVLVGLSGIGKSSLASAYVHDRADSYDCVFWVDAEDKESILASFRRIVKFLSQVDSDAAYGLPSDQVLSAAHTELSRHPGRWAVIFDNVSNQRLIDPWIPRSGDGDVLITSIDSAARYGSSAVLPVGPMTAPESVELLGNRLHLPDADRAARSAELTRLANALSCWPLALELAAGYIDTCGISLDATDRYLDQLKTQSLSDQSSLPPGYPRTIPAALAMCIGQLRHRAASRADIGQRDAANAGLALAVLGNASFVAARRAPIHMLAGAVLFDSPKDHIGVWHVHPDLANLGEVIRELRRFSLVTIDGDLPAVGDAVGVMDANRTIAINSVVQELLRPPRDVGVRTLLDRLADHVQRWLTQAMDLNALERASVLFTHAEILAAHLRRYGTGGRNVALLYGNLAGAHWARGDLGRAQELLLAELAFVDQGPYPDDLLATQAKISLVSTYFGRPAVSVLAPPQAIAFLNEILRYSEAICGEHPNAAVKFSLDVNALLDQSGPDTPAHPETAAVRRKFDRLLARLGPTHYSEIVQSVRTADSLISEEKFPEAESLCRQAIRAEQLTGMWELETRRILAESLVRQRKWGAATNADREFRQLFGSSSLHVATVLKYAANVGYQCALWYLREADTRAEGFLLDLLDWPTLRDLTTRPADGSAARICLLAAVRDLTTGDYASARAMLQRQRPASLAEGGPGETGAWCALWQLASLAAFRLAYRQFSG